MTNTGAHAEAEEAQAANNDKLGRLGLHPIRNLAKRSETLLIDDLDFMDDIVYLLKPYWIKMII